MKPYIEVANAMIKKYNDVLGHHITLERAQEISGIHLDADGYVHDITGDPTVMISALLTTFSDLLGPAAASFSRSATAPIVAKHPELNVPFELRVSAINSSNVDNK
jgi:hypothetical protein